MITPGRIWKCGKCGHAIRTVTPEWVREWLHTEPATMPGRPQTGPASPWFRFVLSWQRPGLRIESHTRYEPVYEQRQRQVQVGEEPIYEERIRQVQVGEEPIYEERTRQVEKKVLWGLFGTRLVTETYKVQIGTRPIMKSESHRVRTGTRPIMQSEPYTVQVGTRPIVEEKQWGLKGHAAATKAVCFSDDGLRVLSTGDDRYIFTWDCASGHELHGIQGHHQKISGIICLPAGVIRHLLLGQNH